MPTINSAEKQASEIYAECKDTRIFGGILAYKIYRAQGFDSGPQTMQQCFVEADLIIEQHKNQDTVLTSILATLIAKADQLEGTYA